MAENLEVWWNGSHKDTYLCVREPEQIDLSRIKPLEGAIGEVKRGYRSRDEHKRRLFALFTLKRVWLSTVLRRESGIAPQEFYNLLNWMAEKGIVDRSQRGVVTLNLPQRKAEP